MPEDREKERVGVTLFKDQHRWLKQRALDHGVNGGASAVVRAAIDFYRRHDPVMVIEDEEVTS